MTGITRSRSSRTAVLLAAAAVAMGGAALTGVLAVTFLSANPGIGRFLLALIAILALTLPTAFIVGYWSSSRSRS